MFYSLTQLSNHPILPLFMVEFFQRISKLVQLCFYNKRFKNELFVKCTTEAWNLISVVHWTCFIMSCAIIASKYIWNGSIFARRLNNHLVTVFFEVHVSVKISQSIIQCGWHKAYCHVIKIFYLRAKTPWYILYSKQE